MQKTKFRYLAALLVTSLFCSFNGFFGVKLNGMGFSSYASPLIRFAFSLPFTFLMVFCRDRSLFRIRLCDLWVFFLSGVCGSYLSSLSYFLALRYVSTSITSVLLYTSPFFVMLLSRLTGAEPITRRKVIALVLAVLGCALVSGIANDKLDAHPLGLLLGLVSGIAFSLYTVCGKLAMQKGYDTATYAFYNNLLATLGAFAGVCVFAPESFSVPTVSMLPVLTGIALISYFLPNVLYTYALNGVDGSKASIMSSIEPALTTVWGLLFLGEAIDVTGVLGIALVLVAIVLINLGRSPAAKTV